VRDETKRDPERAHSASYPNASSAGRVGWRFRLGCGALLVVSWVIGFGWMFVGSESNPRAGGAILFTLLGTGLLTSHYQSRYAALKRPGGRTRYARQFEPDVTRRVWIMSGVFFALALGFLVWSVLWP